MDNQKAHFLIALCISCIFLSSYAQQPIFDEYRKIAGDYAALYSNKVEAPYISQQYVKLPYWETNEFRKGIICYEGLLYTDLMLRYDMFNKSLIVVTPEKRLTLQVDTRKVDYFILDNQKFIPYGDHFAVLLYESPQLQLLQYVLCMLGDEVEIDEVRYKQFDERMRFFLCKEGKAYNVSSLSSVLKLFPEHKKKLKRFAREQQLYFRERRAEDLAVLISYIDSFTNME